MSEQNQSPELIKEKIELEQLKYHEAVQRDAPLIEKKEIRLRIRQLTETLNAIYKTAGDDSGA